jgi:hypothetical protein
MVHAVTQTGSPPHRDTQCPNVTTRIKGAERDGVFAGRELAKVKRVALMTAIRNSVVGKRWNPRSTINTYISLFDLASCVINIENNSD